MSQAESVALPKRLPLVIQAENRDESADKDAKLINAYMEKSPDGSQQWVYKRPGLLQDGDVNVGEGLGVYNWRGLIYAIFGEMLYEYDPTTGLTSTPLGAVSATGGVYRFCSSLGTTPRLQLGNGVNSYNYDPVSGWVPLTTTAMVTAGDFVTGISYTIVAAGSTDFTLIGAADSNPGTIFIATGPGTGTGTASTTGNFPAAVVKGWAYLDGTTYVMGADAYIHGSDTAPGMNRPDLWVDVTNTLGAQIEPDQGVFLTKQLVYVLALKEWSVEVFYDAQNSLGACPLGPVQGAKLNYGCVNGDSVQEIDGALLWLATNRSSAMQIVMLDSLKLNVISTKAIERLLGEADFSSIASLGIKYEGHRFYVLTLKNDNITLVYDLADKMWSQWTGPDGNYFPYVSSTFHPGTGRIIQHESNGKLYRVDAEYFSDNGETITVDLYAPNFDGGVRRRKQLNMMEFVGDQTAGSVLQVRVNDSDYDPIKWSSFRNVDMSVKKPVLVNCGTFMRRAVHIRHQMNTRMRLQAVELQIDLGTL
jgi:hypothetical protein